jgi:site-specific DNA recombinase
MTLLRTALYARVSTQRQAQTQTILQQLERLRLHAQQMNWPVVESNIFCDEGFSGSSLNRPALQRLRDQIAQHAFDQLLITDPDRLARNYVQQMLLLEEFEKAACHLIFLEHAMSADPHDQLLLQIRGAVAEYERNLIAERMRRGRQARLKAGTLLPWTYTPYGYQVDPDRPRDPTGVRPDEVAAAVVVEIFERYTTANDSLLGIATYLTLTGIPTPTGLRRWNAASVRGIVTNPTYTGTVYGGRKRTRLATTRRSPLQAVENPTYTASLRPPEEWICVAQVPAIISQAQFELAQAKLAKNQSFASRNNTSHQYLLRALVSCGHCKSGCSGRPSGQYLYYVCRAKGDPVKYSRDQRCTARFIPAAQLDELVWQDLCQVLTDPDILTLELARAQSGDWLPQELAARRENLQRAQSSLDKQVERLTTAYLDQILELEEYRRRRADLEQRRQAMEVQLQQLEVSVNQSANLVQLSQSMHEFCQRVQRGLSEASFEHKRELLELLVDRVVVTDEQVEIRYVIPTSPESEKVRFCHLRKAYFDLIQPARAYWQPLHFNT